MIPVDSTIKPPKITIIEDKRERPKKEGKGKISKKYYGDLTGKIFGRLKVIKFVGKDHWGNRKWECQCNCGNITVTPTSNLASGHTQSCGCLGKERRHIANCKAPGEAALNQILDYYHRHARRRNLIFELTRDQFIELTKQNCFYCDRKPNQRAGRSRDNGYYFYNGIDRLDNTRGYTIQNAVPACKYCNSMKGKLTKKQFIDLITKIYEHQKTIWSL